MSHIDELLKELCPDGVPVVRLGEIAQLLRGNGMPKTVLTNEGVGAIHYGQIYTRYGVWATETFSFVSPETAVKLAKADPGDIIITNTSENVDEVCKAVAWLGEKAIVTGGHATVIKHAQNPKYLSYWFQSESFLVQKKALASGTKVIDVSSKQLMKVRIPVPPLEVQREIVRILDQFTQLEAELEAELETRSRQYTYFQQHAFLALDEAGVQKLPLRDVGKWYGGGTPSKARPEYWKSGTIPWISPKDMGRTLVDSTEDYITEDAVTDSATRLIPKDSVALVVRSSILNHTLPIAYVPVPASLNQDMKAVIARPDISPRYLFHALRAYRTSLLRTARRNGGSVASIESRRLWEFEIPVPDATEQERLVKLLDNFDALLNDPTVGLPAELAARRKQFEYYRDRLLTFKEAAA